MKGLSLVLLQPLSGSHVPKVTCSPEAFTSFLDHDPGMVLTPSPGLTASSQVHLLEQIIAASVCTWAKGWPTTGVLGEHKLSVDSQAGAHTVFEAPHCRTTPGWAEGAGASVCSLAAAAPQAVGVGLAVCPSPRSQASLLCAPILDFCHTESQR